MSGGATDDNGRATGESQREPPRAARAEITVAELEQWVDHGATWRALEISDDHAVVEMCTCYGEPVDVREGATAELIDYLRSHRGD